jgi:hypothetical protein
LLCALAGHLVANALLDEGQYVRAGLEYTWRASFPALIQAIVILAIAAALGPASRRLDRSRSGTPMRGSLTVFATSQVLLFLTLELTERVIQRQPFAEGLFGSDFTLELVLALACALVLAVCAALAIRFVRSVRRQITSKPIPASICSFLRVALPRRTMVLAGGVRAPPSL